MIAKHILKTHLTNVKKIIHLSDIHIRLYKRHMEYIDVFTTLYDSLKKRNLIDAVIVISGDIVHSKTDMSPEMVQVVSNFLTSVSNIAPTIVIPGNHDLNLSNPNRLDALSPIIENLSLDNLYYLRNSGVYQFANLEFGAHSIIGSPEDWPTANDLIGVKIALYHAPVNQAQTDTGYKITNRVTVEDFVGYDMVMLGDIHKTQILQEKSIGIPEIAYAGSLIQQNHGELPTGHGYLVWDVATCKIEEFVEVPNKIGYYTLALNDKTMPLTPNMPSNVRLRLYVGDVDDSFVKKTIAILRTNHNIIECTINRTKGKSTSTASSTLSIIDNMNDVTQQNVHIRSFIETEFPNTAPDLIDRICEINTTLNNKIGDDELPKNINWKPLLLEFDNLFSYGEDNKINFETMSGLYGVFSPNATGKTSAFDALCFALYDKTPRAFKGSHIMNTRRDEFSCTLTLNIENKIYTIERTGVRKKNGEVKVDVNFYSTDENDVITSLNGEDRRDTNAAIRSYVGTYEDFILTTMSVQNQNTLFIETGQSDRKDLLSQFIGLTVFDRLFNLANDEMKEVVGALKSFKKTDFTQRLATAQTDIEQLTSKYNNAVTTSDELKTNINTIQWGIEQIQSYIVSVPEDYNDINVYVTELDSLKLELNTVDDTIVILQTDGQQLITEISKCKLDLSNLGDYDTIVNAHKKYQSANAALSALRVKLQGLSLEERHITDKIKNLKKHKYDPNCKFCINNVFVVDAKKAEDMYYTLRDSIIKVEDDIEQGVQYITTIESDANKYPQWIALSDILRTKEQQSITLDHKLTKSTNIVNVARNRINDLELLISASAEFKQISEQNKIHNVEINVQLKQKQIIESNLNTALSTIMELYGKLEVLKTQKEDMLSSIREAEELETTYEAYETYIGVIGRDGLPYKLIGTMIPTLQLEVNNILEQIVDFTISLDIDGKNINGRIIYDDTRMWPLELASGMERFIGGLAIRIALMSISNLPKSNFLVIDEGLGVLDADNLSSMTMMFDILSQKFEFIILISHLEATRDIAENLIEISRDDGYSKIIVD